MAIVVGTSGIVEGPTRYVRNANGDKSTVREWSGMLSQLRDFGDTLTVPYEIVHVSGPVYRLNATYAGALVNGVPTTSANEQVVTVWTLKVQQRRADLWEHPKVRAELEKISDLGGRALFLSDLRAIGTGEVVTIRADSKGVQRTIQLTLDTALAAVAPARVDAAVIRAFVAELCRGVDGYNYDTFVLTKKRVGPAAATNLIPSFAAANIPVSSGVLLASESTIPNAIRAPINRELGSWYWLRNADELNQLDSDRVEVNSQWVAGTAFSSFIYGP